MFSHDQRCFFYKKVRKHAGHEFILETASQYIDYHRCAIAEFFMILSNSEKLYFWNMTT